MSIRKLSYTKAVIICHGKSESHLCKYIKQNLRLCIEVYDDKNGEKSIQITSLNKHLNNSIFKNIDCFYSKYPKLLITGKGKKKKIENFKLFIIMDTDDCTITEKNSFIDKNQFINHWAYEYIVPIYNISNLEKVLLKCKIDFKKHGRDIKKQYIKIFPTDTKYIQQNSDHIQVTSFLEKLQRVDSTNLDVLVQYCLECNI